MTRLERHYKHAIASALDNLEAGDQREATLVLLEALEDAPGPGPPPCRVCGQRAWPGDTTRHIHSLHLERAA